MKGINMENTCNFGNCKFAQNLFDMPEECFNYIESWWTPSNGKQPILVKDCIPKRQFIMIQELYNQQINMRKDLNEQRNKSEEMKQAMFNFTNLISEHNGLIKLEVINEDKLLEDE